MQIVDFSIIEDNKLWISSTGYRVLLVLTAILDGGKTSTELLNIIKTNNLTNKAISPDTLRVCMNTLKASGCILSRPSKSNGYKYKFLAFPFILNLSPKEADALLNVRTQFYQHLSWQDIIILNTLYEKIFSLTFDNTFIEREKCLRAFEAINKQVFKKITDPLVIGKKVSITYLSPKFGEENFSVIPYKINYENGKLYLNCYSYKYKINSILNIERIININSIEEVQQKTEYHYYEVVYVVLGNALSTFKLSDNETIIEKTDNYIKVKACVENEFWLVQKLLSFGADFKIISPYSFKEKLIHKLLCMKKGYDNDQS